jgi:hypothetical protein
VTSKLGQSPAQSPLTPVEEGPGEYNQTTQMFNPFLSNNELLLAWNQYLFQWQETGQQFFQSWWRVWGLPTREELGQTGQQIFDLANRLEVIEDELNILIENQTAEYAQLARLEELFLEIKAALAQSQKEQDHSHLSRLRVVS